jgi:hypothetical protein
MSEQTVTFNLTLGQGYMAMGALGAVLEGMEKAQAEGQEFEDIPAMWELLTAMANQLREQVQAEDTVVDQILDGLDPAAE